jgi:hypothetical protein
LLLHEVGEDAGVGGEACECDSHVLVDGDDLLLVGGEFFGVALRGLLCQCVAMRMEGVSEDEHRMRWVARGGRGVP